MQIRTIAALFVMAVSLAGQDAPLVWRVVVPEALAAAIEPLAAHRRAGGFAVEVVNPADRDPSEFGKGADFLLLVGDAPAKGEEPDPAWHCPAPRRDLYRWREQQPPTFLADALLGDRDGDLLPDVPVGRIPFRTPDEVGRIVAKIIAYETQPPSVRDLRVVAWACAPGYGGAVDDAATKIFEGVIRKHMPAALEGWLLSAAPGEPLCGVLEEQPQVFLSALEGGFGAAAIAAHASRKAVLVTRTEKGAIRLRQAKVAESALKGRIGGPLFLLACDAGDFGPKDHCIAETFLALEAGPVAVLAATTESHPMTNYFTGQELARALGGGSGTWGEVWRNAQTAGAKARSFLMEAMLKDVEGKLEPKIDTAQLRRDQPLMYAFLGDPATGRPRWKPLEVRVKAKETGWEWEADLPEGWGVAHVGFKQRQSNPRPGGVGDSQEDRLRAELATAQSLHLYGPLDPARAGASLRGTQDTPGSVRVVLVRGQEILVGVGDSP